MVTVSLFADDTMIVGRRDEIEEGERTMKESWSGMKRRTMRIRKRYWSLGVKRAKR